MDMVKKLGMCLIRGVLTVLIVPLCYHLLKGVLLTSDVLEMVASQGQLFGFVVEIGAPIVYIICALIYTFAPLFQTDRPGQTTMVNYLGNTNNIFRRKNNDNF